MRRTPHASSRLKRHAVRRIALGGACAVPLVLAALPGVAWADITVTEGQSFSGQLVATGDCGAAPGNATIDWGDGTTSPGTRTADGMGVQGTHTYTEEGSFNGTVTYDCPQQSDFPVKAAFQATVQDASLMGAGQGISGTAGQSLTAVSAHVTDVNPSAGANDISAMIGWGDGTSSAGTVSPAAGGGFDVTGTHTYSAAGSYPVSTTITDTGGSSVSATSTAQIMAAPPPPVVLGPPQARFTYSPASPCSNDFVQFDASSSSGGGRRIIGYSWTVLNAPLAHGFYGPFSLYPVVVRTPTEYSDSVGWPTEQEVIGTRAPDLVVEPKNPDPYFEPPPAIHFRAWNVTIYHRPADVKLQITARNGRTDYLIRRITFRDPIERAVVAYKDGPGGGGPGLSEPLATVKTDDHCDSRSYLKQVGLAARNLRPTLLSAQTGNLQEKGQGASVVVRLPCLYAGLGCDGVLEVDAVGPRHGRGRRHAPNRRLGVAGFLARAGQSRAIVAVRLNTYGRALARAHNLRRVTLRLISAGADGTLSVTTRTIIIVGGRTGTR